MKRYHVLQDRRLKTRDAPWSQLFPKRVSLRKPVITCEAEGGQVCVALIVPCRTQPTSSSPFLWNFGPAARCLTPVSSIGSGSYHAEGAIPGEWLGIFRRDIDAAQALLLFLPLGVSPLFSNVCLSILSTSQSVLIGYPWVPWFLHYKYQNNVSVAPYSPEFGECKLLTHTPCLRRASRTS